MAIVPKQMIQQPNLIVEFQPRIYKKRYECPKCKNTGCFIHCNHCGQDIKWKDEQGDARYENKKRMLFNPDFSIHRCMTKGTKDGQLYHVNFNESDWKAEMRKYSYKQQHWMCIECAREFNKEIYPLCPSCWKMECRQCHARVPWRANKETFCVDCGCEKRDVVHVWRSMYRLYGIPKGVIL